MSIRNQLHKVDPYKGLKLRKPHVYGWGSEDPNFKAVIDEVKPKFIIECGTWLGASAIHMAQLAPEAEILCVDTWLGSREFWLSPDDDTRYGDLALRNGYPSVYFQFLSNVAHRGLQDRVIPFPTTSLIAARVLKALGETCQLCYLDASHDYEDVLADLEAYWPLVEDGGILFGDDHETFMEVALALDTFGQPWEKRGRQWVIRK